MKKLFLISALFILSSFAPLAPTLINNGDKITSAGTTEVELEFNDDQVNTRPFQTVYITIDDANTGTIQFSVGTAIDADHKAWGAGAKIVFTVRNGVKNLRYKASAASQSFVITQ
jgi:hypothetical protein